MTIPAGAIFAGPVSVIPGATFVVNAAKTRIDFTVPTLPAGQSQEVSVNVEVRAADHVLIKNSTATGNRPGATAQVLATFTTQVLPSLAITLSANKSIARPGEVIRYILTATNWASNAITSAKVVNMPPIGTALFNVATANGADEPTGRGSFNLWPGQPASSFYPTPTSNPSRDSLGILTWNLGTVPARVSRTIEFEVQVKHDIPTSAYVVGVDTPMVINNFSYNFVGTPPSGSRIFAAKPALGTSLAAAANAASLFLVSKDTPPIRSSLGDPPLTPPNLTLIKSALADGIVEVAGEQVYTLINDTTDSGDGRMIYLLGFSNVTGAGTARNVVVRDYIPTGMLFEGFITRNGIGVPSYLGFHFYDAAGKEIPGGGEAFTDSNGNGIWNSPELFTDSNGNKKYDGIAAIRSLDLPAGDLAGGAWGFFGYRVQTTSTSGVTIVSNAGGLSGLKEGLNYTLVPGYHLRADNLHFPINGGPKQVKVLITVPASFSLKQAIKSRGYLDDDQTIGISFPYEVVGGGGVSLSNITTDLIIPKGYRVDGAEVYDSNGVKVKNYDPAADPGDNTIIVAPANAEGVRAVTFRLDGLSAAFPMLKLSLDPANTFALQKNGQTIAPLKITPIMRGSYTSAGSAAVAFAAKTPPPPPKPMTTVTGIASVPTRTDTAKDTKIFVGRCAPVSVRRGETFTYTIFVGNLTSVLLEPGTIEMAVPAGCTFVSATAYRMNAVGGSNQEVGFTVGSSPAAGSKITWKLGTLYGLEGGAVTLTVKVREDFTGTRIDDNTCKFDVLNACGKTPGPLGVVVRPGNATAGSGDILQSAVQGLLVDYSDEVRDSLTQSFQISNASCTITCGGADMLQMTNGTGVVKMGLDRVLIVGPQDQIQASGIRLIKDGTVRVAVGPGGASGVNLVKIPGYTPSVVLSANTILNNLQFPASSIVAGGGGNIVAGGGGNMVAGGGGNLIGQGGTTLIGLDGASLIGSDGASFNIAGIVAGGGGNLIGQGGSTMVAGGGGNMVAGGGGNIVAGGGGNLIGQGGSTIAANESGNHITGSGDANVMAVDAAGIVNAGAGNLVAQDGATVVAAGGANLFSIHTGNLIQEKGTVTLPNK